LGCAPPPSEADAIVSDIVEAVWHGMEAVTIEGDVLRATIIPGLGAKIASLVDKRSDHEWLVGPGSRPVRPVPYGATWAEHDMSGWDEMFPTINACPYPGPAAPGTPLPDHGEVWSMPWSRQPAGGGELALGVTGRALPYRLTRTTSVEGSSLRLRYGIVNLGKEQLSFLWAAHPQFTCTAETRILLPPEVHQVLRVYDPRMGWQPQGTPQKWPEALDPDGHPARLDRVGTVSRKDCRKLYLMPGQRENWAGLVDRTSGNWLRLKWDASIVPYLGIWIDEGCFNTVSTVALEPTTGFYDSLATAAEAGRVMNVPAQTSKAWEVVVEVGTEGIPWPSD
jgi:galactose mutarotase-like enzyme